MKTDATPALLPGRAGKNSRRARFSPRMLHPGHRARLCRPSRRTGGMPDPARWSGRCRGRRWFELGTTRSGFFQSPRESRGGL